MSGERARARRLPAMPRRGSHARGERAHWGRRVVAVLGVLLLVGMGGTAVALTQLKGNIRTLDLGKALGTTRPSAAPVDPDGGRAVNFLVMGSDSRTGDNAFIGGKVDGARSDTTLVVHLSANRTWAMGVSIPRDSVVEIPECVDPVTNVLYPASRRMFNDAFTVGGPACTIKTVESLTGVRIDHFVVVDFAGFKKVVDALGTVPVCVTKPIHDSKAHLDLPAGMNELDGETALAYVRTRYSIGDGSDLGRIERQQVFLTSVLQKATSAGTLANPARTYNLLSAVTSSLVMDPELSSLPKLATFAQSVEKIGLGHIQFATVPNEPDPEDINRLVWSTSAADLWSALARDERPVNAKAAKASSSKASSSKSSSKSSRTRTATPQASSDAAASVGATASPSASSSGAVDVGDVAIRSAQDDICG